MRQFYYLKMKNNIYLFVFYLLLANSVLAQNSFQLLIQNEVDQVPTSLIETSNEDLIVSIYESQSSFILKLNNKGEIIDSLLIENPVNGTSAVYELQVYNELSFVAFGSYQIGQENYLSFYHISNSFTIIDSTLIPVPGEIVGNYLYCITNSNDNLVVTAPYKFETPNNFDIFIFELSIDGTILKENTWGTNSGGMKVIFDITENKPGKYYLVSNSISLNTKSTNYIYELDSSLNIINQGFTEWGLRLYSNISFLNDSIFLLSGVKYVDTFSNEQMGILKMDINYNELDNLKFGKQPDTADYPAFHRNLSHITLGNFYYGGISNIDIYNLLFSTWKSWIILNKFDENLNISWTKFYGGDAYYNLIAVLATQDGGCVMAGSRYDYQTQNQERDVYILKVDEDGILTWTQNIPVAKLQNLVYPNPGHQRVTVNSGERGKTIEFYSITSKIVLKTYLDTETTEIDVSSFSAGVYFYRIFNEAGKVVGSGKWIKQ